MNWNKFGIIASIVIGILSLAFAAFTLYYNREKATILEINRINDIELTKPLNIKNLSSTYVYDSIPVEHLWQSSFVITNRGETTIYGEGFDTKNIKGSALRLHLTKSRNILTIDIVSTNTDVLLSNDSLYFSQWKPNEYIEIKVLSDGSSVPELTINERDIQDAQIIYTKYSPEVKKEETKLIDQFPRAFSQSLWWIVIIFDGIMFICFAFAAIGQYQQAKDKVTKIVTVIIWTIILFLIFTPLLWMC